MNETTVRFLSLACCLPAVAGRCHLPCLGHAVPSQCAPPPPPRLRGGPAVAYSVAALARDAGPWRRAKHHLLQRSHRRLTGQQWRAALQLLREMPGRGVTANTITYSAAACACEKGLQWGTDVQLSCEKGRGFAPNTAIYRTAVCVCEEGQQWRLLCRSSCAKRPAMASRRPPSLSNLLYRRCTGCNFPPSLPPPLPPSLPPSLHPHRIPCLPPLPHTGRGGTGWGGRARGGGRGENYVLPWA